MVKRYRKKDPYAKREAQKYDNPIPSREFIIQYLEDCGKPCHFNDIVQALGLKKDDEQQERLHWRLKAMVRDGQLMHDRKGRYGLVKDMELVCGRVIGHKDGFGWVRPENENQSDIFLPPKQMRQTFHNDRVLVRARKGGRSGQSNEGIIVEILEHGITQVVGRFFDDDGVGMVEPDNKRITRDIIIPESQQNNARHNQFVVAEITSYPNKKRQPVGRVTEVLGDKMQPGMEVDIALRAYDIPFEWPQPVLKEADSLPAKVHQKAKKQRTDLRELPFVTIDGEDAKDFDDAVYCEARKKGGWRLFVAIADVDHYVKPGSCLEQEALRRGNSVYFPNRVVPMLPEKLSNGLCSLNPKKDRLTLVCEMSVSAKGRLIEYQFHEGVIQSHARLTYEQVAKYLQSGNNIKNQKVADNLGRLYELYHKLHSQRRQRGAIDFETTETKILFNKKGKIKSIVPAPRTDAHRIIEECMLLANVSAAKFLQKHQLATLFRIHERPDPEKLQQLREFLGTFGLTLGGGDEPTPKDYAKLLSQIDNRSDKELIQTVVLRSMQQAVYSPDNIGHFGLAYQGYLHFTSPIRRYPDLLVHRAIRHLLRGGTRQDWPYEYDDIVKLGNHVSMTERRAEEAERQAIDRLKCEFMQDKLGKVYDGVITGVTGFGVFVQLKKLYVEGLVHITALPDDYYHHDEVGHQLVGKRSGRRYRLNDQVRIQVTRVDIDERLIDFEMMESKKKHAN